MLLAYFIFIIICVVVLIRRWHQNNTRYSTLNAKFYLLNSKKLGVLSSGLTCISSTLVAAVSTIALLNLAEPSYKAGDPAPPDEPAEFGDDEHDDFDRLVREALKEHQLGNLAVAESTYKRALGFSQATQSEVAEVRISLAKIASADGRKLEAWAYAWAAIGHLDISADTIDFYAGISIDLCQLDEALVWLNRLPKPLGIRSVELKQRAEDPATTTDCAKAPRQLR